MNNLSIETNRTFRSTWNHLKISYNMKQNILRNTSQTNTNISMDETSGIWLINLARYLRGEEWSSLIMFDVWSIEVITKNSIFNMFFSNPNVWHTVVIWPSNMSRKLIDRFLPNTLIRKIQLIRKSISMIHFMLLIFCLADIDRTLSVDNYFIV